MHIDWIGFVILLVLRKSGELILGLLLAKFWGWVLSDENLHNLTHSLKLKILVLYLHWLLQATDLDCPEGKQSLGISWVKSAMLAPQQPLKKS